MTENERWLATLGADNRICLPKSKINLDDVKHVEFFKTDDPDRLVIRLIRLKGAATSKIKLYCAPIGKNTDGKYYGIIMDFNGTIVARVRSSQDQYLKKDLTILSQETVDKLNNVCGPGLWEYPIYIAETTDIIEVQKTILDIRQKFTKGLWPR